MTAAGLLLAAGAGRRMGRPKALVTDPDGTSWLVRSSEALTAGGCTAVTVVLGAGAHDALALVPAGVTTTVATDWAEGMGASLRTGLHSLAASGELADAVVVLLVDLPDVGPEVVARLVDHATATDLLARAAYDGVPGHPVLLGRDHWAAVAEQAAGDSGARDYLAAREVVLVECGDLASGRDQDTPPPARDADAG